MPPRHPIWPFRLLWLLHLALLSTSLAEKPRETWQWTDVHGETITPFADTNIQHIVIVFIDPVCPVANYFHPTLQRLANETKTDTRFIFFHPDSDVTPELARTHAKEFNIAGPVILDPKQTTAKRLDADVTPEAFLISRDGTLHYRGRINDMYIRPGRKRPAPRTHDLKDALAAVRSGNPVRASETQAIGCYIFYETE